MYCFCPPTWRQWRHTKMLYTDLFASERVTIYVPNYFTSRSELPHNFSCMFFAVAAKFRPNIHCIVCFSNNSFMTANLSITALPLIWANSRDKSLVHVAPRWNAVSSQVSMDSRTNKCEIQGKLVGYVAALFWWELQLFRPRWQIVILKKSVTPNALTGVLFGFYDSHIFQQTAHALLRICFGNFEVKVSKTKRCAHWV